MWSAQWALAVKCVVSLLHSMMIVANYMSIPWYILPFGVLLTVGAVWDGSHGCVNVLPLGDRMRYDELWCGAAVSADYSRRT